MKNKMQNILLYTIKDAESLGQIFSTYSLYKAAQRLGYNPVIYDELIPLNTKVSGYIKEHCCISSNMHVHSDKDEYIGTIDVLLTGTENVWRYSEEETVDMCFLNWGKEDTKRVAYAPGFGKECNLPLGPKNAAFFALKKFAGISVADSNTLSILNLEFGIDAETVCNPILLVDQYPHFDVGEIEGLFISVFFDKRNRQKQKVTEMAEEIIKYRILDYSRDAKNIADTSADEYLTAIEKSALIITDSAAIMHLAVVYKKPFILVLSKKDENSAECLSTLESLGLMERVIYVEEDVREKKYLCRKPIRYGLVDSKLDDIRLKSIQWLESSCC